MSPRNSHRAAALVLSFLGAAINVTVAAHLVFLWHSLKWESDSEWEGSGNRWGVDGVRIVWALLSAYFVTASVICLVGVAGVIKRIPAYVRLYRDHSVAELCLCALSTVIFAFASFRPAVRAILCEELSGRPELLRDLADAGLNLENCEQWFEHAVIGLVGVTAILLVVRLQFILTVSACYSQLLRQHSYSSAEFCKSPLDSAPPHRIYLLPARSSLAAPGPACTAADDVLVYAPVPLSSLSEADTRNLDATEAWVSRVDPHNPQHHRRHSSSSYSRTHRHSHPHSHSHSHSHGRISLPIREGEALLPSYTDMEDDTQKSNFKV